MVSRAYMPMVREERKAEQTYFWEMNRLLGEVKSARASMDSRHWGEAYCA